MVTKVKAIYQDGLLRPLGPVDWPENMVFEVLAAPVAEADELAIFDFDLDGEDGRLAFLDLDRDDEDEEETLADILGFDPDDEEKLDEMAESQFNAMQEIMGMFSSDKLNSSDDLDAIIYL